MSGSRVDEVVDNVTETVEETKSWFVELLTSIVEFFSNLFDRIFGEHEERAEGAAAAAGTQVQRRGEADVAVVEARSAEELARLEERVTAAETSERQAGRDDADDLISAAAGAEAGVVDAVRQARSDAEALGEGVPQRLAVARLNGIFDRLSEQSLSPAQLSYLRESMTAQYAELADVAGVDLAARFDALEAQQAERGYAYTFENQYIAFQTETILNHDQREKVGRVLGGFAHDIAMNQNGAIPLPDNVTIEDGKLTIELADGTPVIVPADSIEFHGGLQILETQNYKAIVGTSGSGLSKAGESYRFGEVQGINFQVTDEVPSGASLEGFQDEVLEAVLRLRENPGENSTIELTDDEAQGQTLPSVTFNHNLARQSAAVGA